MKMRYKVYFHVLLYFLSSRWMMMESQASSNLSQSGNVTQVANTFLINANNNNHSEGDNAEAQHTLLDLASTNENHSSVHGSQNGTIQMDSTKIQPSKFIDNKLCRKAKCCVMIPLSHEKTNELHFGQEKCLQILGATSGTL